MESNLPPELIFKILKYLPETELNKYMLASKETLQSGQEIKKSKSRKLLSGLHKKDSEKILSKVNMDPLYWSKIYKETRKKKFSNEIIKLIKKIPDSSIKNKTNAIIQVGNIAIDNKDILKTMDEFQNMLKTILLDYYKDTRIPDESKRVIEIIYLELFPETFDETFGYKLNIFD
jgi:hypothetical protein